MLDNISQEGKIANKFRTYLIDNLYSIIQLIFPGGQAGISINYIDEYKHKRFCYPDVIAYSKNEIIIGEIKPKFSQLDYQKLIKLKKSTTTNIYNIVEKHTGKNVQSIPIIYCLIHGQYPSKKCEFGIKQFILHKTTFIII